MYKGQIVLSRKLQKGANITHKTEQVEWITLKKQETYERLTNRRISDCMEPIFVHLKFKVPTTPSRKYTSVIHVYQPKGYVYPNDLCKVLIYE